MKRTSLKKSVAAIVTAGILSLGVAAFATEGFTPAEIIGDLTGQTVEAVQAARGEGETYGTVANDAGVLDAFQSGMLENRKAAVEARVTDGTLTREEADVMLAAMQTQIANCDGTGTDGDRLGQEFGAAFGQGNGLRDGTGVKTGGVSGNGQGRGQMLRDGSGEGTTGGSGLGRGAGRSAK